MMRSLYAGVSGLKNHQTRMDVIGNNIANVNTIGFKKVVLFFRICLVRPLKMLQHRLKTKQGQTLIKLVWECP